MFAADADVTIIPSIANDATTGATKVPITSLRMESRLLASIVSRACSKRTSLFLAILRTSVYADKTSAAPFRQAVASRASCVSALLRLPSRSSKAGVSKARARKRAMASAGPPNEARGPLLMLSSASGAGVTEALRAVGAAIEFSKSEEAVAAEPAEWRP